MSPRCVLAVLAAAALCGMAPWFSASAVAPTLAQLWRLGAAQAAWLTISVRLGFVLGALVSALLTLSDRWSARRLFAGSAAWGRTLVTSVAMVVSGSCALSIGTLFGRSLALLGPLLLVWGVAVVADSAQFSAAVSELAPADLVGTALTLQTSLGFLLTCFTIYLLPWVAARIGWRWSMGVLALGPAGGVAAMLALRRRPEARLLAGGRG